MNNGKRYAFIDVLYTLGTILVILGHSHPSDWNTFTNTFFEELVLFIYVFHMPLFFFIAGFLFSNSSRIEQIGLRNWLKEKAIKLLTPYAVLSIIAALPKYYFEQGSLNGVGEYLFRAILIPREGVWGHFWFLPVLMIIYLIFGIVTRVFNQEKSFVKWCIAFIFTLVFYFIPINIEWFGINDIKKMLIYFLLGMFMNIYGRERGLCKRGFCYSKIVISIFFIVIAWLIIKMFYGNTYTMFIISMVMIVTCLMISLTIKDNFLISWISRNNFTIYIYSWPFQAVVMDIFSKLNQKWYVITIVMFVAGLVMPIILIKIYRCLYKIHCRALDLILGIK